MRRRWVQAGLIGVILAALTVVIIGVASSRSPDSENRAYELEQQLRCPVCQSVSIAESMSETAEAMRGRVDQLVDAGKSDQQVLDYFRSRYGEWVVLDPPAHGNTLLVWILPLLAGIGGATAVLLRQRQRRVPVKELPPETRREIESAVQRMRTSDGEEESL
ncbi:cytochrome c-type biogenesis protein [Actinopolyspora halophila]|uniref:cytochrome c-type biogenesis protein n=1 Tax=Actinopolyspora halophila TaxID=1850 RepID=UPI000371B9F8|nr:cytochrome c-type biogenesis protein [Actinopolyspora halophila]